MQYIVKACRTSGIPLFSDFSDIGCFDAALETGLLSSSDWSVLNETAVVALLRSLKKEEERKREEAKLKEKKKKTLGRRIQESDSSSSSSSDSDSSEEAL